MSEQVRKAEAKGKKTATVNWREREFVVSTEYDDWTVDLVESLEEGKAVGIVRGALGPAQWRVVQSMALKMSELGELSELIAAALGFGSVGESPASSA